ncbi:alpha/beta hydrolase [Pedobacter yulinensis]|uniref:Alpha/beta hydrolase n=1 Tax=Pedobacter yulinensis TaxID=2126353 RepID=A0A2T3HQQ2_9SPHI|nr:alpha/beta hydrolase [Pedobacter yulinensis]PST84746.1 alpha/beta hydrolase [Pedobacter yulinensis]
MNIYLISGLGADKRNFQKLDLAPHTCIHLDRIDVRTGEPLQDYAGRLVPFIDQTQPFALVGVSFGGLVAQELSRYVSCRKLIIISSIKTHHERGLLLRLTDVTALYRLVPTALLMRLNNFMVAWLFGVQRAEERRLLRQILDDTDPRFVQWAVPALLSWRNRVPQPGILHLHGTADRIFPARGMRNVGLISGGGHLMVYTHASHISLQIRAALNDSGAHDERRN